VGRTDIRVKTLWAFSVPPVVLLLLLLLLVSSTAIAIAFCLFAAPASPPRAVFAGTGTRPLAGLCVGLQIVLVCGSNSAAANTIELGPRPPCQLVR